MSEETRDPELADLEQALVALRPVGDLDRDRLMFRAGQASVPRRSPAWPWATAALGLFALALGGLEVARLAGPPRERVVFVQVQPPAVAPPEEPSSLPTPAALASAEDGPTPPGDYLKLRDQVVRWGAVSLPSAPPVSARPDTLDDVPGLPLPERPGSLRLLTSPRFGGPSS